MMTYFHMTNLGWPLLTNLWIHRITSERNVFILKVAQLATVWTPFKNNPFFYSIKISSGNPYLPEVQQLYKCENILLE